MENILMPAVGSNQHITKFDETKKRKKLKIKFATKVKIAVILLTLISLFANYKLLKTFMVFKCSAGGYLMSKEKCGELEQNLFDSQELARQVRINQELENNPDLK